MRFVLPRKITSRQLPFQPLALALPAFRCASALKSCSRRRKSICKARLRSNKYNLFSLTNSPSTYSSRCGRKRKRRKVYEGNARSRLLGFRGLVFRFRCGGLRVACRSIRCLHILLGLWLCAARVVLQFLGLLIFVDGALARSGEVKNLSKINVAPDFDPFVTGIEIAIERVAK